MTISFNSIPSNLRVPFVTAEFDNSKANEGPALLAYRALIIGQKTSAGTASANTLHKVTSADAVAVLGGQGSMLHRQALAYFAAPQSAEVWIGVLADDGAGVAATKTITITGPATADGSINLMIGGSIVRVAVSSGDAQNTIAAAVHAAVNDLGDLPVTAGSTANAVTLTLKNKGAAGQELDVRVNYYDGEALPAGVGATIANAATGATNPVLTSLIAAMGDRWFHVITHPYTDSVSTTALTNELADRNGPLRMIDGVAITANSGTHSAVGTLGGTLNDSHHVLVSTNSSPTPPMEYAAHIAGVVAYYGNIDPARPFQTLPLPWIKAPAESAEFTIQERNLLLYTGVSTTKVSAGKVRVDRLITTYQESDGGSPDESYLDLNTLLTLMLLRYSWRTQIANEFPRSKLAPDGTRFGAGQAVVTPKEIKGAAMSWFHDMEDLGLVTNFELFKAAVQVEINDSDPNRVDVVLPPNLMNALIVTATKFQFTR